MYEEKREKDIDCRGDVISYKCEILSNSEELHLIWHITSPGIQPMMIHYDNTSNHSVIDELGLNITSVLTHYIADEYIESLLVINNDMIYNFHLDRIHLECFIANLSTAKKTVLFRASGVCTL